MKVLVLSHSSELSGAELSMIDLFDYWHAKKLVEPQFIIRRPFKNMPAALKKRGWGYTGLYYTNWSTRDPARRAEDIYRSALFNTKAIFDIEKLIDEIQPDVVMTNTIVSPWAAIAAYFKGVPHVWFVREYGDVDHQHIFEVGREKMFQDIGTLSQLVVTNSRTLAEHISEYIDYKKITTLYTPFNLEVIRQRGSVKVKSPFKQSQSLKLVFIGRIAPSKGQQEAVEAVYRLNKAGYETEICLIGGPTNPSDADLLHTTIKKRNISEKVHLVGRQSNPLSYVAQADVGITASMKEAFGRVTFEYMSLGKAVVGSNAGATPELIDDGVNGFLYSQGSVDSLVKQLKKYADDRTLINKHGNAAAVKANKMMQGDFSADSLYEKIYHLINHEMRSVSVPLNYAHRWLEYPTIAKRYIKDSEVISIKRLAYHRFRHLGKLTYLWVTSPFSKKQ
jgi:glycosyltransferase involved in cell wall biosynthesis